MQSHSTMHSPGAPGGPLNEDGTSASTRSIPTTCATAAVVTASAAAERLIAIMDRGNANVPIARRRGGSRQRLSVEARWSIIAAVEAGVPRRQVMRDFGLKHSSNVTTIMKRRESIARAMGTKARAKAIRSSKFPMIDKELRDFMAARHARGRLVARADLTERALALARKFGVLTRFKASKGYIDKFLQEQAAAVPSPDPADQQQSPAPSAHLRRHLLQQLRSFAEAHLERVNSVLDGAASAVGSDDSSLAQAQADLLSELRLSVQSALRSLADLLPRMSTDAYIDVSEHLFFRILSLEEHLLRRFLRLTRDCLQAHLEPSWVHGDQGDLSPTAVGPRSRQSWSGGELLEASASE